MVKIIESQRLEIYLIALVIVSIGLKAVSIPSSTAILAISFFILFFMYLIRMFISFRHWKFSKGISIINSFLNVQILICLEAITFVFLNWPGHYLITYVAITGTQMFIAIILIFLILKRKQINRTIYWEYLGENTVKAIIGMLICFILFYKFDMASHINNYPPDMGFGFSLPSKLF